MATDKKKRRAKRKPGPARRKFSIENRQHLNTILQAAIDAFQAGRIDEAIRDLAQGASMFPGEPRLWGYLGFLYAETGDDGNAVQALRKAANLSPRSETASLGLFHSLWRTGKTDAAFSEMRRFVKLNDSPCYRQLLRDMLADTPRPPVTRGQAAVA